MSDERATGLHAHNLEAEKIVLGVVLAGEDIDGLTQRRLAVDDFYDPAHRAVYSAYLNLEASGSPRDVRAVTTALTQQGQLGNIPGGATYLVDLTEHAPAASALKYYVDVVKDAATTRSVAVLGQRAQQLATTGDSPAALLEKLRAEIDVLSNERGNDGIPPITDVITATLNEVDLLQSGKSVVGVPTGFTELDERLNGLQPGQLVVIAARPAMGKALDITTPILTPNGWTTMKDLQVGDHVYDRNGQPTKIVAATDVMSDHVCYTVKFSDGSHIVADADHQWAVTADSGVRSHELVLTTQQMFDARGGAFTVHSPNIPANLMIMPLPKKRTIDDIVPHESVPVRCIEVENPEHLYLAGPTLVPTHNSSLALDMGRHAAIRHDKSVLVFSLEMGAKELGMRALAAEAYVDLRMMRIENGIDETKWMQINAAASRMAGKRLGIDDDPNTTLSQIRAKARMWERTNGLDLIIVDYLQLMNADTKADSRQQEVSEMSRGLKLLAKELGVPVIALSQLNRGPEQRTDKKPMMSDLRESGAIEQDADVVLLLHREDAYDRESPRAGEADVIIAKQRNGPTGTVVLSWLGKYARFDNRSL